MGNEKGQALIELALVLLLLMIILFGIEEFGRYFFHLNTIKNAAREGVRKAVVTPDQPAVTESACPLNPSPTSANIVEFTCSRLGGLTSATVQVNVFDGTTGASLGSASSGDRVQVIVRWDFEVIGLVPFFNDRTIVGDVSMRHE